MEHQQDLKLNRMGFLEKTNQVEDPFKMQTTNTTTVPVPSTTSTTTPPSSLTGSISGTIRDTAGDPLGGVRVVVVDKLFYLLLDYSWSDSEGHYVINDLPTGDYYVAVSVPEIPPVSEWYQDADPYEGDPPPVHVDAPNETARHRFHPGRGRITIRMDL